MIPENHYYGVYDADGNLLAHTGITRPTQVLEEVRYCGGRLPYTVEMYTQPRSTDNTGPAISVERGNLSLSRFVHGHEPSTEVVSARPNDQTMIMSCSCGWKSAIGKHDVVTREYENHISRTDPHRFGRTIDNLDA